MKNSTPLHPLRPVLGGAPHLWVSPLVNSHYSKATKQGKLLYTLLLGPENLYT